MTEERFSQFPKAKSPIFVTELGIVIEVKPFRKKIFFILALLCTLVQVAWAQNEWDAVYAMTQTTTTKQMELQR